MVDDTGAPVRGGAWWERHGALVRAALEQDGWRGDADIEVAVTVDADGLIRIAR
ncbi:MAG: hypothetical protein R2939_10585 [Kofleriaceae bacterium]